MIHFYVILKTHYYLNKVFLVKRKAR